MKYKAAIKYLENLLPGAAFYPPHSIPGQQITLVLNGQKLYFLTCRGEFTEAALAAQLETRYGTILPKLLKA